MATEIDYWTDLTYRAGCDVSMADSTFDSSSVPFHREPAALIWEHTN